ncbi:hypothetical protein AURDEDRAFT_26197, partial [Auricularia subglabra TFB-10046 SS5]
PRMEDRPYREEDVLIALQLLAYLSKYPHVRQAFYKKRVEATPKCVDLSFFLSFWATAAARRGPVAHRLCVASSPTAANASPAPQPIIPHAAPLYPWASMMQSLNIFSLMDRFTFRPSANEVALPSPPDFLPPEIQYWPGFNACRKDDSRGGIRQCATMLCGKWEESPGEFAKCRRCRKARYCGKECHSRTWGEGQQAEAGARQ